MVSFLYLHFFADLNAYISNVFTLIEPKAVLSCYEELNLGNISTVR